jgi:hypothetical protein
MNRGHPTHYKPEYCDMLVDHMNDGLSFESFAGVVGTCKQTLYNWAEANPDFLDAKKQGFEKSRLFWEKTGTKLATGQLDGNATMAIFNLKNRFPKEWRDKQEMAISTDKAKIEDEDQKILDDLGL